MGTAKKDTLKDEIRAGNKQLAACLAAGDTKGMRNCYTKDGVVIPPNAKPVKGGAIAGFWAGAIESGVKGVTLRTNNVEKQGSAAIELGTATLKGAKGETLDTASYLVVWKREGGKWKLHYDMFSSNNPA